MAPSPLAIPEGCAFRDRCPFATPACASMPEMRQTGEPSRGHAARCHHPLRATAD
jgi:peptide/nickel transport system ATP-binding protein